MNDLEIRISQDIRKFKTKDVGNFSFKEAAYIAAAMAVGYLTYRFTSQFETAILPVGIVLVIGFFKPYGMSFIQFMRTVVKEKLTTQCYINETDFEYSFDEFKELYGDEIATHYDGVIPADVDVNQTNTPAKINKKDGLRIIT